MKILFSLIFLAGIISSFSCKKDSTKTNIPTPIVDTTPVTATSIFKGADVSWLTEMECLANMNDMVVKYARPVMVCEIGMSWIDSISCNSFIKDIIAKTKSVNNGQGLGVFYWEPEAYNSWQGYTLGAFNNSGKPTAGLDAFK